jgi:hypothetical protein
VKRAGVERYTKKIICGQKLIQRWFKKHKLICPARHTIPKEEEEEEEEEII